MGGFELSEWIDAAPGLVFETITDTARAPEVVESTIRMEQITPGPMGAGTVLRETRVIRGTEAQTELTVDVYDPPSRYVVSTVQDGITVAYTYALRAERGGTLLRLSADVRGDGLKKLMVPLVTGIMKREDGDHLQRLKQVVEAG